MEFFTLVKLAATYFTIFLVVVGSISWLISKFRKKKVHYGKPFDRKKTFAKTQAPSSAYGSGPYSQNQNLNQIQVQRQAFVPKPVGHNYNEQAQIAKQRTMESAYNIRSYTPQFPPKERFQVINAQQPELRKIQLANVQPQRPMYVPRPQRPAQNPGFTKSDLLKNYASGKEKLNKLNFGLV